MPTPAEKKALIFVSAVALLGSGVRVWRMQHPTDTPRHTHDQRVSGEDEELGTSPKSSKHFRSTKSRVSRKKNARSTRESVRDSTIVIDLDRATVAEIEAIGVLKPGLAKLIVDDRENFGPFGSLREVERVPYLTRTDLRKLVSRVTFSLQPRPKNAVMWKRPDIDSKPVGAKRQRRGTQEAAR